LIQSFAYFVVGIAPLLLALGLAFALVRAVGIKVVWREDE
jgi:hypothetical protein